MTEDVNEPKVQSFFEKLQERVQKATTLLCIGLDPHRSQLPENSPEAVFDHCSKIIYETQDFAAAFKPNIAFFEQHGAAGITVLLRIVQLIPQDIPIILDCKRGDIGTTAQAYATSAFSVLGADAVTLSPYMGWDSVKPFVTGDFSHKGAFILCKTSNPSSSELQDRLLDGNDSVYEHVARLCVQWGEPSGTEDSPGACIGLVAGATDLSALHRVRVSAPDAWILCPGVGAQGGDVEAVCSVGLRGDGSGLLVAVSRGISSKADMGPGAMATEARELRDHINALRLTHISPPVPAAINNTASSSESLSSAAAYPAVVVDEVVTGVAVTEAIEAGSAVAGAVGTGAAVVDAVETGASVLDALAAGAAVIDSLTTAQTAMESLSASETAVNAITTVATNTTEAVMSSTSTSTGTETISHALQPYQQEFISFALANNSLQFGTFTLKSGRISPYFFNAGTFCSGRSLNSLGRFYAQTLADAGLHFDVLFGPAYKGIPLATAVAMHWQQRKGEHSEEGEVKIAYNRKEAKDHGEGGELVGASVAGQRVVIIDDVITAGTAIRASVELLRRAQAEIVAVVVCLDRQERVSESSALSAIQQVEEEFGFPVLSIVRLEHLAAYVAAGGSASAGADLAAIEAYCTRYGV